MLQMILLRMWRARLLMMILFVGLCLVTAFLSLGPLYVRAIAAAEFEAQLNRSNTALRIDLRNELPIDPTIRQTITDVLGERVESARPYITGGAATCGFEYNPESPDQFGASTTTTGCYFTYAYPEFDDLFTLAEGQLPASGAPSGRVEAVITSQLQAESGWEVGKILIYGEDSDTAVVVEIVGIVDVRLPETDPFWAEQYIFEEFTFFYSPTDSRQERGFIVTEADYLESIRGAQPNTRFSWRIFIDRSTVHAAEIGAIEVELDRLTQGLRDRYPSMEILSTLDDLLRRFQENVSQTQPPITFLSALVLVLMLYNMVTITALIQEQQMQEWAMFASRGGSTAQLIGIQFVTVFLLNAFAVVLGPLLAIGLLFVLTLVGPQAAILEARHIVGITPDSILLSLLAAVALQIVLMIPAWNGARDSLLRLKREAVRPVQPLWARYGLDAVLIIAGLLLLLRLYGLATGSSLFTLLSDPTLLIRTLAEGDISVLLSDPFSLAAPALLLVGLTLLWIRLFPMLIGLLGRIIERRDDLLPRLALWNLERNPGHYSQMVLLLIGTLALGTASLVLSTTRETGAWELAQNQAGADAAVTFTTIPGELEWQSVPGVQEATEIFLLEPEATSNMLLIGIESGSNFEESFPQLHEVAPLVSDPSYDVGGQMIPSEATMLRVDIYAASPEVDAPPIETLVDAVLKDRTGRPFMIPLSTENSQASGHFVMYEGNIPTQAQQPLAFSHFAIFSEQDSVDTLRHVIYLDNLRGITESGEEISILRFEPDEYADWDWLSREQGVRTATLTPIEELNTEGQTSLRVQYVLRRTGGLIRAPQLGYRSVPLAPLPVVLSPEMADILGQRGRESVTLEVGDMQRATFDVLSPDLGLVDVDLEFTVVAIRETFNAAERGDPFLIADKDLLLRQINTGTAASLNLRADTVWLALNSREPAPETLREISALTNVSDVDFAWYRYNTFLREPLPNAISGVLFAGFWISLLLSLMDFAFYLVVTIRQRAASFATLRALGWSQPRLPQLLLAEQILLVSPALLIGILVGVLLAGLIVPFLALTGSQSLQIPLLGLLTLVTILVISFTVILRVTAISLHRQQLTQVMRFGD